MAPNTKNGLRDEEKGGLLAPQRQQRIGEHVTQRGDARITDLAQIFAVTEETVRRDLKQLEAAGVVRRVHGGAIRGTPAYDTSLSHRMAEAAEVKDRIAAAAVPLIGKPRTVFIDEGSLTVRVAKLLVGHPELHILTNMPAVAEAASAGPHEIELTGGILHRRDQFLRGEAPLQEIRNRLFDLTIMGTSGFDLETGMLANESYTAQLRRLLVSRSRRVMVLTRSSNFGRNASWCIAPFSSIHTIVTDEDPPKTFAEVLSASGVHVEVARCPMLEDV